MPRRPRFGDGGFVYHALNRAVGRATVFHKAPDYAALETVLQEAQAVRLRHRGRPGRVDPGLQDVQPHLFPED